ncbi:MAG: hypothetical protein JXA35_09345, partial [Deltaproteobacteria bacterium]|nr:hypothetical protein [Deltaproteobacteria bacterium]
MKPIVVASLDSNEAEKIKAFLEKHNEVRTVNSADILEDLMDESSMVILDHGFCSHYGLAFLADLFSRPHPQFFLLAPPDEIETLIKTMEIGIQYVPMVTDY